MAYDHGVEILETPTSLAAPVLGTAALQVVVGVSPVNLAEDPYNATNIPKLAHSLAEASAAVGYSGNLKDYNLNQSISATFTKFAVAPIILINVLNPKNIKQQYQKQLVMWITCRLFCSQRVFYWIPLLSRMGKTHYRTGQIILPVLTVQGL